MDQPPRAVNVSDSGHLIFGLYPPHASTLAEAPHAHSPPGADGNTTTAGGGPDLRNHKAVFFEQPDGHFVDFNAEGVLRRRRIAARSQLELLRSAIPDFSPDDDAITFAPFFLKVVLALMHIRRMLTGLAAGFSLLVLLAIYHIPSLGGVAVDINTGHRIGNSTIGGAHGMLCLNETMTDCSSIVAYASVFKVSSYFFLLVSLLGTFLALVPFTFDVALYNSKSNYGQTQQQHQMLPAAGTVLEHPTQNQFGAGGMNNNPGDSQHQHQHQHDGGGGGGGGGNALPPAVNPWVAMPITSMITRHLFASTLALYFVALCCSIAIATIEVDRRQYGLMVAIDAGDVGTVRTALILRSTCFLLAWLFSFKMGENRVEDDFVNYHVMPQLKNI